MLALKAMEFARVAHATQLRKYTGNPYTDHLAEVAGIAACIPENYAPKTPMAVMIATAWLHDAVEDQGVSAAFLRDEFGEAVAAGVLLLSDLEAGNRADRKAASRARLANAPGWVQTIKCADLISNTSSIVKHDPKFAAVYLEEKRLLLDVMTEAHPDFLAIARKQVEAAWV